MKKLCFLCYVSGTWCILTSFQIGNRQTGIAFGIAFLLSVLSLALFSVGFNHE